MSYQGVADTKTHFKSVSERREEIRQAGIKNLFFKDVFPHVRRIEGQGVNVDPGVATFNELRGNKSLLDMGRKPINSV